MRVDIDDLDVDQHQRMLYNGELFTGTTFDIDRDGQLIGEAEYVAGLRNGLDRDYYSSGQIEKEEWYTSGLPHGLQHYWYPNGQLEKEVQLDKGLLIFRRTWSEGGTPVDPETRKPLPEADAAVQGSAGMVYHGYVDIDSTDIDDQQCVLYNGEPFIGMTVEVDKNGHLIGETDYVAGIKNGADREYYPSGQIESEVWFESGLGHGTSRFWYETGQLKEERQVDRARLVSRRAWAEDGTPVDPETREPLPDTAADRQE